MRRNRIITALLALAGMAPANAQYTFTLNVSWSGNCSGYTAQMNSLMGKYKSQAINGFPTRELCEQTRAMCHQELGHIELVYIDTQTGKVVKREATNCKLNVTTTPCTGRPMAGTVGTLNALGVSQGTSYYSANSANEIQNWSSDDMERMLALDKNFNSFEPSSVSTGDNEFDKLRNNYSLSGKMPNGSTSLIQTDGQIAPVGKPIKGTGVVISDEFFEGKPFDPGLGKWSSSDLSTVNIDLSSNASMDNSYGMEGQSNSWSNLLSSMDNKLDYYNALEQGDANFLQYMYTRWGKENVMEGLYWWEKNNMSNRISNAYNIIQDAVSNTVLHPIDTYNNLRDGAIEEIKDNVDVGVGSTIRFLLPPQYKETGERTQAIYDTEKGIITDVLKTVKEAPDMISRGETIDITQTLENYNDRVQGLAASYGSPEMSKAYGKLKSAADIYNLPQEKQKKGLLDMFKKEGKGIVKSEIKNSGYYKKIEKNAKKIVDPFNFIFE